MGLRDLKSNLDIHGGNQAISQAGSPTGFLSNPNPPHDGGAFMAQGPEVGVEDYDHDWMRDDGNLDSPFTYKEGRPGYPTQDDHLVAMLERRPVASTNTDPAGPLNTQGHTNPMTYSPTMGGNGQGTLDSVPSLNNSQYGNGLFNTSDTDAGVDHPGHGQGYKVDGEDLHIALLNSQAPNYHKNSQANYGAGQPGGNFPGMNPSPSPAGANRHQDLNTTAGGIGNAPGFAKYRNPYTNPDIEPSPNAIDTVSEQGLEGLYTSTVNANTTYNSNWPTPSRQIPDLDLNGSTPTKYLDGAPN